ncbi:WhiB family transcriptional regulator [Gleimia europaea]|uniref:WhiB family transcriptional regulator n=1 Tax=Gleimia europaea TaxID=66228 RepID=UPI000C80EC67|nr:WhiB family transcriptional regulator [Gleimia europaea]WIK62600.1 WhiB family transcriptional regulator [Gleimia europaea]
MTWQEQAACAGLAPDFDITGGAKPLTRERAKAHLIRVATEKRHANPLMLFCDACPVRRECLADAVGMEVRELRGGAAPTYTSAFVAARHIRGGLTGRERAMHYAELIEDDRPVWQGLRDAAREWLKDHRDPVLTQLLKEKQK